MKKIISLIFLGLFLSSDSNALTLMPLEKYCKEHDLKKDHFSLGYVTLRCGSLFSYIAGIIERRIEKQGEIETAQGKTAIEAYLKYSSLLLKSSGKYLKEKPEKIAEMALPILNLYIDDANKNYLQSGNYVRGSYIENDLNICRALVAD